MSQTIDRFTCSGCHKTFAWRKELAGRKLRCKCGHMVEIPIPAAPSPKPAPVELEDDGLFALAELEADARTAKIHDAPVVMPSAQGTGAGAAVTTPKLSKSAIPLAYQRPLSKRERERDPSRALTDTGRDLYAPLIVLLIGAILYISYYAIHYRMGISGIVITGIGLSIMTIFETAILVGFAFVVAGPLGVGFGTVGPAILKLAAIAVFCDGITTWVDGLFAQYGGVGSGILGFGAIGLPIALGVYWFLLIYLFRMDSGDSWLVVVILSIFYPRLLHFLPLLKRDGSLPTEGC